MQLILYIQLSPFAFNFLLRNLIIKTAPPSVALLIITDPEWTLSTKADSSLYALRLQLNSLPPWANHNLISVALCTPMLSPQSWVLNPQSSLGSMSSSTLSHAPRLMPRLRPLALPAHYCSHSPPSPSVCCFFFFVFVNKLPGRLNSNYAHILRAATET